jgi:hypothetical protein
MVRERRKAGGRLPASGSSWNVTKGLYSLRDTHGSSAIDRIRFRGCAGGRFRRRGSVAGRDVRSSR